MKSTSLLVCRAALGAAVVSALFSINAVSAQDAAPLIPGINITTSASTWLTKLNLGEPLQTKVLAVVQERDARLRAETERATVARRVSEAQLNAKLSEMLSREEFDAIVMNQRIWNSLLASTGSTGSQFRAQLSDVLTLKEETWAKLQAVIDERAKSVRTEQERRSGTVRLINAQADAKLIGLLNEEQQIAFYRVDQTSDAARLEAVADEVRRRREARANKAGTPAPAWP